MNDEALLEAVHQIMCLIDEHQDCKWPEKQQMDQLATILAPYFQQEPRDE